MCGSYTLIRQWLCSLTWHDFTIFQSLSTSYNLGKDPVGFSIDFRKPRIKLNTTVAALQKYRGHSNPAVSTEYRNREIEMPGIVSHEKQIWEMEERHVPIWERPWTWASQLRAKALVKWSPLLLSIRCFPVWLTSFFFRRLFVCPRLSNNAPQADRQSEPWRSLSRKAFRSAPCVGQ